MSRPGFLETPEYVVQKADQAFCMQPQKQRTRLQIYIVAGPSIRQEKFFCGAASAYIILETRSRKQPKTDDLLRESTVSDITFKIALQESPDMA